MISLHTTEPTAAVNVTKGALRAIEYRGADNVDYAVSVGDRTIHVHGKMASQEVFVEGADVYVEIPVDACTSIGAS